MARRNTLTIAGVLAVLIAMVRWGGTARPGPLFLTGVALFIGAIFTFCLALWWLYVSPLPEKALITAARPRWLRQLFAILVYGFPCLRFSRAFAGQGPERCSTRCRSRSKFARPYIWRLTCLRRLT